MVNISIGIAEMSLSTSRETCSPPCVVNRQTVTDADDVVQDVPGPQVAVLHHHADLPPHQVPVEVGEVSPIVVDPASGRVFEAQRQPEKSALARA